MEQINYVEHPLTSTREIVNRFRNNEGNVLQRLERVSQEHQWVSDSRTTVTLAPAVISTTPVLAARTLRAVKGKRSNPQMLQRFCGG